MRRLAVVIAVLTALAACGTTDERPPAVGAHVQRSRLFEGGRALQLLLRAPGGDSVEVTGVRLVSSLFEPLEPDPRVTVVPPGRTVSRPLRYGAARCPGAPDAVLEAVVDGARQEIPVALDRLVQRVHDTECAAARILDEVDVRLTGSASGPAEVAASLVLSPRRGDVEAVVEQVESNVVFAVEPRTPLPSPGPVDLVVTAARCEAHALIESKKTYRFPAWLRVDGGEPVRLELTAAGAFKDALDRAIDECVGRP